MGRGCDGCGHTPRRISPALGLIALDLAECADWKQVSDAALAAGFHVADVRDVAAQDAAVAAVVERYGAIDVLVTAAGISGGGPVHLISAEDVYGRFDAPFRS